MCCSSLFTANFEQVLVHRAIEKDTTLVSSLITLNKFSKMSWSFYWKLWTCFRLLWVSYYKLMRKTMLYGNFVKHLQKHQSFIKKVETKKGRAHFQKRCLKSARLMKIISFRPVYQEFYKYLGLFWRLVEI